jgi:hypothetical protein
LEEVMAQTMEADVRSVAGFTQADRFISIETPLGKDHLLVALVHEPVRIDYRLVRVG